MSQNLTFTEKLKNFFISNAVPILFVVITLLAVPVSGFSANYLIQEMITRIGRNSFLVLSLLLPIIAGMGLNFGMVLGAMAGQIGLIFITDWSIVGIPGLVLAMLISTPISILLGILCGSVLNRAKGREMATSYILGFFINGVYQLVVLYFMGGIIPVKSPSLVLSRGYGIRNTVALDGVRQVFDNMIPLKIGEISIPLGTFFIIALLCLFILWFRKTKLGQDMRAIAQDMKVAQSAGIPVDRTRIISIVISTVLAGYGQIIFLQNMGTLSTYNSHDQTGVFSIAAILIGGATVSRATIPNVFIGVILFHMMFVVSPMAGKNLIGQAMLGEYFRQFISYGIIAIALVLHAWRRQKDKEMERRSLRGVKAEKQPQAEK
ncbi:MAG TPA: ABC transporter permease [Petrotogaceae bacterium]|jgi:simple sugar transport system permease protein|nr:ABC transporter permease [Petrotogaceae bacterium]HOG34683.1 ABC transporter permease [Petrotogaceae bacterium]HPO26176.1 ABC transporter permease [Petrotogaceae bacterium]